MVGHFIVFCSLLITSVNLCQNLHSTISFDNNEAEIKETYIEVDDSKLYCRIIGKGKPLFVIHGGPGLCQTYLLPQMDRLSENNLLIFYDQRGCGLSTGSINDETITMEQYVKDIEAIRKKFGFEKISVLGHSWGGFLAMHYAIAHQENIEKLILSNSMGPTQEGCELFVAEWKKRMAPYFVELDKLHILPGYNEGDSDVIEQIHRIIFRMYCFNPEKAKLLSLRMTSSANLNGSQVYKIIRESVFEKPFDLLSELNKLEVPTLIIHGDADPIPPTIAEEINENIPNSKFVLMENCGHFPYVEDPEVYFESIQHFLDAPLGS